MLSTGQKTSREVVAVSVGYSPPVSRMKGSMQPVTVYCKLSLCLGLSGKGNAHVVPALMEFKGYRLKDVPFHLQPAMSCHPGVHHRL